MKNKNIKTNTQKNQVLKDIWNIQRTIPTRKRSSHRNDKNRRKNKPRHTSIQSNQIIQHKTRNRKIQQKI